MMEISLDHLTRFCESTKRSFAVFYEQDVDLDGAESEEAFLFETELVHPEDPGFGRLFAFICRRDVLPFDLLTRIEFGDHLVMATWLELDARRTAVLTSDDAATLDLFSRFVGAEAQRATAPYSFVDLSRPIDGYGLMPPEAHRGYVLRWMSPRATAELRIPRRDIALDRASRLRLEMSLLSPLNEAQIRALSIHVNGERLPFVLGKRADEFMLSCEFDAPERVADAISVRLVSPFVFPVVNAESEQIERILSLAITSMELFPIRASESVPELAAPSLDVGVELAAGRGDAFAIWGVGSDAVRPAPTRDNRRGALHVAGLATPTALILHASAVARMGYAFMMARYIRRDRDRAPVVVEHFYVRRDNLVRRMYEIGPDGASHRVPDAEAAARSITADSHTEATAFFSALFGDSLELSDALLKDSRVIINGEVVTDSWRHIDFIVIDGAEKDLVRRRKVFKLGVREGAPVVQVRESDQDFVIFANVEAFAVFNDKWGRGADIRIDPETLGAADPADAELIERALMILREHILEGSFQLRGIESIHIDFWRETVERLPDMFAAIHGTNGADHAAIDAPSLSQEAEQPAFEDAPPITGEELELDVKSA